VQAQLLSLGRREGLDPADATVRASEVPQSDFLLQSGLALPEEFGKIYLGETFRAYVSVVNSLSVPIVVQEAQVSLKSSRSAEVSVTMLGGVGPGQLVGGGRVLTCSRGVKLCCFSYIAGHIE
jgi:hypothetical protein